MKSIVNLSSGLILIAAATTFFACGNDSSSKTESTDSTTTVQADADHASDHTFRCPMHPEVVGKEGDTCPKCGMKLEHNDGPVTADGTYFMEFSSNPATIEANKDVTLSVTPKKKDASTPVALDITHEKKIHFILVSDDLSWFDHIHPEFTNGGAYDVKTKFPFAGKFKAFADYKPTGAGHVVDKIEIDVKGNAPAAKKYTANQLSGSSDKYTVELIPDGGKLATGTSLHISGVVKKEGKEIDANTLDNYLGAKAHFVLVSLNEKEYLHVHPEVAEGKFDLHTTIEKPGIYRGWIQFNGDGKIHTIPFTMNVSDGQANANAAKPTAHNN